MVLDAAKEVQKGIFDPKTFNSKDSKKVSAFDPKKNRILLKLFLTDW